MVKAIARGFRWQQLMLDGVYNTISDIAEKEKICPSFVSRISRLATLSPRVIEAIVESRHPPHLTMKDLFKPFPSEWALQEQVFLSARPIKWSDLTETN